MQDRLRQGRSRPVPGKISKAHLESKLIWKFLGSEPPIHLRRTLDQFGYPNLRSTAARDDDQMLWKRTRKSINLKDEIGDSARLESDSSVPDVFEDGKVLMVDQLWLWVLDQRTVVTFFPTKRLQHPRVGSMNKQTYTTVSIMSSMEIWHGVSRLLVILLRS